MLLNKQCAVHQIRYSCYAKKVRRRARKNKVDTVTGLTLPKRPKRHYLTGSPDEVSSINFLRVESRRTNERGPGQEEVSPVLHLQQVPFRVPFLRLKHARNIGDQHHRHRGVSFSWPPGTGVSRRLSTPGQVKRSFGAPACSHSTLFHWIVLSLFGSFG